ncbi:acyl-CoA dehydrogenase family protein [Haliea sp. E1-2-M8]|uniref:acyl-CoA dehydrogenase family protein n=1 Tax=Haliea sp. E1-2-M8 TaxID=3064706 RepID=UPI00271E5848|nr:acyl-CoA dehydrogenase family protein [Haliea sp. E1-2-M8]MDO8864062.1 acyl-CoA dehydrogenase family protein [Haliea sp. E1-2-M8]
MTKSAHSDSPEQKEFRQHCREWLRDNPYPETDMRLPPTAMEIQAPEHMRYFQGWQKAAYDAGLVGCDYPIEVGGGGRNNCQHIANAEMFAAKTPFLPNVIGLGMAAPTLFHHGSKVLGQRLLPKLFSGEEIWCQGFSEPGAGSDLANVQTFAERDGDKWIINGHKVWTSLAHFAEWMILLLRTDKADKYRGMSYFVVPIRAALGKGVTVRPLIKITGETGFNEVLFDNLEVNDAYRLDEVGNGWQVAMTTLLYERGGGERLTPASGGRIQKSVAVDGLRRGAYGLIDLARGTARGEQLASDDPIIRDRIMQNIIDEQASRQNRRRARAPHLIDHPTRISLQQKLLITEIPQNIAQLGTEIAGLAGSLGTADQHAPEAGRWPMEYMASFGSTIAGGTSEIQRNILGERVLGLPKTK